MSYTTPEKTPNMQCHKPLVLKKSSSLPNIRQEFQLTTNIVSVPNRPVIPSLGEDGTDNGSWLSSWSCLDRIRPEPGEPGGL